VEPAISGISRILCPIDLSIASAPVADQATAIAGWYKARILASTSEQGWQAGSSRLVPLRVYPRHA
jgi:hypothetical protein